MTGNEIITAAMLTGTTEALFGAMFALAGHPTPEVVSQGTAKYMRARNAAMEANPELRGRIMALDSRIRASRTA